MNRPALLALAAALLLHLPAPILADGSEPAAAESPAAEPSVAKPSAAEPVVGESSAAEPAVHRRMADDGTDQRIVDLAELIVRNQRVKSGEHVLISAADAPDDLVVELIRAVRYAGGIPHARIGHARVTAEMNAGRTDEQFELEAKLLMAETQAMDVVIKLNGETSPPKNRIASPCKQELVEKHLAPVSLCRHEEKRLCQLCLPTAPTARRAGMSKSELRDYYLRCALMDFAPLRPAMEKLKALMEATDQVRITGPGTDLTFSIKGIPAVIADGEYNLPDGEVFTAPVRDSVNGTLRINLVSHFGGMDFADLTLHFENGKIVEVSGKDKMMKLVITAIIEKMGEDAHYLGEFGIGVHPLIRRPIADTLFDEKTAGSFHIAIGRCYTLTPNGNRNTLLHWDLVVDQRAASGGGEMYFDGKLIRKDGVFTDPELAPLNPTEQENQ